MNQDVQSFNMFLKDKSMSVAQKNKLLRQYAKSLGMKGAGKKSGSKLVPDIVQNGGSWGSFVNFFKKAGNTVANAGKTVYNKALKPAGEYVAKQITEKPLTTIGKVAGLAGMVPSPFSGPLKAMGTAATAVGSAIGKGSQSGVVKNSDGKPIMLF